MTLIEAAFAWYNEHTKAVDALDNKATTLAGLTAVTTGLFLFRDAAKPSNPTWMLSLYVMGIIALVVALAFAVYARGVREYTQLPTPRRQTEYRSKHTDELWERMLIRALHNGGQLAKRVCATKAYCIDVATYLLGAGVFFVVVYHILALSAANGVHG
jgi:hypothetical protein